MSSKFPKVVGALITNHSAWIVGSAADPDVLVPRDYDVVVPYSEWGKAAHLVPRDAVPNSFGGWKFQSDEVEVDIWPGELGFVMQNAGCKYAWQPHLGIRLKKMTQ